MKKAFIISIAVLLLTISVGVAGTPTFNTDFQIKRIQFDEDYFLGNRGFYLVENVQTHSDINDMLQKIIDKWGDIETPILIDALPEQDGQLDLQNIIDSVPTEPELQPLWIQKPTGLNKTVYNLFNRKCASCHSGTKPKAGLSLINKDRDSLANLSFVQRGLVYRLTEGSNLSDTEKRMPLGTVGLNKEEIAVLEQWWKNPQVVY